MATRNTAQQKPVKTNGATETGHPVTEQLTSSLHSSIDSLADTAGKAEEKIRQSASSSSENLAARKRLAEQKWEASQVRKFAIENPIATAGIAFAAGMFITSILRKK